MQIDREYIQKHIVGLSRQIVAFQGALEICQQILKDLDKPEGALTVDEFAKMVGGEGATASQPVPAVEDDSDNATNVKQMVNRSPS